MKDKFGLLDHLTSFKNIYPFPRDESKNANGRINRSNFSGLIFQGLLQSSLLDFQIISKLNEKDDLKYHFDYILSVLSNVDNLFKGSKTPDEKKISEFLLNSLLSLPICGKALQNYHIKDLIIQKNNKKER